jgi:hypothetical protein
MFREAAVRLKGDEGFRSLATGFSRLPRQEGRVVVIRSGTGRVKIGILAPAPL